MTSSEAAKQPQIAMIGMEGSGKTVLTTVLAKRLSTMADQGLFLDPLNSKTIKYVEGVWRQLQNGQWPPSTPPGELFKLEWELSIDHKYRSPVRLVDAAGQDMRLLFAEDRHSDESLPTQLQELVTYCRESTILIILINLKDFVGEADDMRRVENQAALKAALDLLTKSDHPKKIAFVFSQCDQYEQTISKYGSLENLLRSEFPYIYGAHYKGKAPALFPVAAVSETRIVVDQDGKPYRVPAEGFESSGLEPLMEWMKNQILADLYAQSEIEREINTAEEWKQLKKGILALLLVIAGLFFCYTLSGAVKAWQDNAAKDKAAADADAAEKERQRLEAERQQQEAERQRQEAEKARIEAERRAAEAAKPKPIYVEGKWGQNCDGGMFDCWAHRAYVEVAIRNDGAAGLIGITHVVKYGDKNIGESYKEEFFNRGQTKTVRLHTNLSLCPKKYELKSSTVTSIP